MKKRIFRERLNFSEAELMYASANIGAVGVSLPFSN